MNRIKLLIVEDDVYSQKSIASIIDNHFQEIKIVDKVISVKGALAAIEKYHPHILILDIHLVGGTGFDVLRQSKYKAFNVVFVSAYKEYAVEALKFSSVDFVYKPFDINELLVAIYSAIEEVHFDYQQIKIKTLFENIDLHSECQKLVLHGKSTIKVCNINEIIWAKAIIGGANFYFEDSSYFFANKPLRRYESILSAHAFFRCHPHYLINLLKVKEVKRKENRIQMSNDDEVAFESKRYHQLINAMQPATRV